MAKHSRSILKRLYSDSSNKIIFSGLLESTCLVISAPIDPPAPEIKKVLDSAFFTLALEILAPGKISFIESSCMSVTFFASESNSLRDGIVRTATLIFSRSAIIFLLLSILILGIASNTSRLECRDLNFCILSKPEIMGMLLICKFLKVRESSNRATIFFDGSF